MLAFELIGGVYKEVVRSRPTRKWYQKYRTAAGKIGRAPCSRDKGDSRTNARQYVEEHIRRTFGEQDQGAVPLKHHVKEFRKALLAKGDTERHVEQSISRIQTLLAGINARMIADIDPEAVQSWLADAQRKPIRDAKKTKRKERPLTRGTARSYLVAIKGLT